MEYTRLGSTGLKVSRIALGCMSFGRPVEGQAWTAWTLDYEAAEPIFRQALDFGITLWDTSNSYGIGSSEDIVGQALRKLTRRDDIVVATKVFNRMHGGPGGSGLSRKAIMEQIDGSLSRLVGECVDLYLLPLFC